MEMPSCYSCRLKERTENDVWFVVDYMNQFAVHADCWYSVAEKLSHQPNVAEKDLARKIMEGLARSFSVIMPVPQLGNQKQGIRIGLCISGDK